MLSLDQSFEDVIRKISLRIKLELEKYNQINPFTKLSVSIGASYQENNINSISFQKVIDKADKALYENKKSKKIGSKISLITIAS